MSSLVMFIRNQTNSSQYKPVFAGDAGNVAVVIGVVVGCAEVVVVVVGGCEVVVAVVGGIKVVDVVEEIAVVATVVVDCMVVVVLEVVGFVVVIVEGGVAADGVVDDGELAMVNTVHNHINKIMIS